MSERTSFLLGVADYVVARRKRKECFLDEIDRLIDCNPLEKLLRKTLKRVVTRDGFVLGGHATPANRSDTKEFVAVLDEVDAKAGESIFADKGYSSQLNRYVLQVRGLADGIMHKAARNRARLPQKKTPTVKSAASARKSSELSAPSSVAMDFTARGISDGPPRSSWRFSSTPWLLT